MTVLIFNRYQENFYSSGNNIHFRLIITEVCLTSLAKKFYIKHYLFTKLIDKFMS